MARLSVLLLLVPRCCRCSNLRLNSAYKSGCLEQRPPTLGPSTANPPHSQTKQQKHSSQQQSGVLIIACTVFVRVPWGAEGKWHLCLPGGGRNARASEICSSPLPVYPTPRPEIPEFPFIIPGYTFSSAEAPLKSFELLWRRARRGAMEIVPRSDGNCTSSRGRGLCVNIENESRFSGIRLWAITPWLIRRALLVVDDAHSTKGARKL